MRSEWQGSVQVRLLGPVDVLRDGASHPVRGARRRALLAALAVRCGEVVEAARLVELVWGSTAPPAANTLQTHVSYLRRTFGVPVVAHSSGYRLELGPDGTDVQVAERLIRQGRRSVDPAERVQQLRTALALWRGRPLSDLADLAWAQGQAQRIDLLWLEASQCMFDAQLGLGEHAALIPELERLTRQHPLHEQMHGQLMLALYRAGRQVEALDVYHRLRRVLAEDTGIDPSQALRDLHTAILRQDPALILPGSPVSMPAVEPTSAEPPAATLPAPAQLPPALAAFTGRARELAGLDRLLTAGGSGAARLGAVFGTAGIGKTTLVVHWAHRVAHQFPDGQLYVNLRGFDPGAAAVDPADAVRGFLDALGVAADRVPTGSDALTGRYRSELAGKRVLVVLDNAAHADQVRPLLPGAPGCLAIVTSRNQLTGLIATDGAYSLTLEVPTAADARNLLTRRLGVRRVAAEATAVDAIVTRCARLPLALAIVAARAAAHPTFPLAALAADLGEARDRWEVGDSPKATDLREIGDRAERPDRLDALHAGDPATDVRSVFSWSYRALGTDAARLFRLLGLYPGADIAVPAAASLVGAQRHRTRPLLAELTQAHLLSEHVPGRYTLHDLLRDYAAELAGRRDAGDERDAAVRRILDHYLHTAHLAATLTDTNRDEPTVPAAAAGVTPEPLSDRPAALAWLATEYPTVLAAVRLATAAGLDQHALRLASTIGGYLVRSGHWRDQVAVQRLGLAAARHRGDLRGQERSLRALAATEVRLRRLDQAESRYGDILHLHEHLDDPIGHGHAYIGLCALVEKRGDIAAALRWAELAHDRYRAAGYRQGQASALGSIGWMHVQRANYEQAIEICRRALVQLQELGYRDAEAGTWHSLGIAYRRLGDLPQAIDCHRHALDLYSDLGSRYDVAETLDVLGDLSRDSGDLDAAGKAWREALGILDDLGHPDAVGVRAKLDPSARPASA